MLLLYEDKTAILRRCLFDVQNEVGLGRQEDAYQRACELWLEENGIPFKSKEPHPLHLGNEVVHTIFPDLVVWELITVELKAVRRRLRDPEFVQIFNYLKRRHDRLGLLVNMGLHRVEIRRVLYDAPEYCLDEDWRYWDGGMKSPDQEVGIAIRESLHTIFNSHGTGYGEEIVRKLLMFELKKRGLSFAVAPMAKAFYRGIEVDEAPLDCIIIEDRILLTFSCLFDDNDINVNRGKSFLKTLNFEWGVAANFGKKRAEFSGLHVTS